MDFKKIKLIIITGLLISSFALSNLALASTFSEIINGFKKTGGQAGYSIDAGTGEPKKDFTAAFSGYINGMLGLMGVLFMILVIYGGYLWMTARGREEQVEKAKKLIINAAIALGIVITARLLVELVITTLGIYFADHN